MAYILILNGPNLNLTGHRNPEIYGNETLEEINRGLVEALPAGMALVAEQYNGEGEIIDALHRVGFDAECLGVVLNAGAYTHYSYAIADAIAAIDAPVIEVHMSNVHAREEFRHTSVISAACRGTIAGFGKMSYTLAVRALLDSESKGSSL